MVEANSDAQMVTAVSAAANISGVSVVSLSFGAPENEAASLGWYPAFESIGSQHPHVTFVVSSGDEHNGEIVDYPSTSPWALSVGGAEFYATTSPVVDAAGDYVSEQVWNQGPSNASAGGLSSLFTAPSWQPSVTGSSSRATPDVSFHGYGSCYIYDSYDSPSAPWSENGGTSVAAPSWAALIAIADQGASITSGSSSSNLGYTAIPALYATYANSQWYSMAFHDITVGNNNYYQAGPGYDLASGLGTPKADVVAEWLGQDVPAPTILSPSAGATLYASNPTFQWAPVTAATSYQVTLTDNTTGAGVSLQSSFTTDPQTGNLSISASVPLILGHSYTFSVSCVFPNLSNPTGGTNLVVSKFNSSSTFTIYSPPPTVTVVTPTAPQSRNVTIGYTLFDQASDACSIQVQYSSDGGTTWNTATPGAGGSGTSGLTSSPSGVSHTFVWASGIDISTANNSNVEIRIVPIDAGTTGIADTTGAFTVNNWPSASVATPAGTQGGNVAISYNLFGLQSDTCSILVQYSPNGGSTWNTATQGSGSSGTSGLVPLPGGSPHTFVWNSLADIGNAKNTNVEIRITPNDAGGAGTAGATKAFTVNTGPTIGGVMVVTAQGLITWNVQDSDGIAGSALRIDGSTVSKIYGPYTAPSGVNYSGVFGTLSAGTHNYTITATDKFGSLSQYTGQFSIAGNAGPTISGVAVVEATGPQDGTLTTSESLVLTFNATRS